MHRDEPHEVGRLAQREPEVDEPRSDSGREAERHGSRDDGDDGERQPRVGERPEEVLAGVLVEPGRRVECDGHHGEGGDGDEQRSGLRDRDRTDQERRPDDDTQAADGPLFVRVRVERLRAPADEHRAGDAEHPAKYLQQLSRAGNEDDRRDRRDDECQRGTEPTGGRLELAAHGDHLTAARSTAVYSGSSGDHSTTRISRCRRSESRRRRSIRAIEPPSVSPERSGVTTVTA